MNDCINSAKEFLSVNDIKIEKVFIKSLQKYVYLKELTGQKKDEYDNWLANADKKTRILHISARLVSLILVNENGDFLFNNENMHELSGKVSAAALDEIIAAGRKMNDISNETIENEAKN